MRILTLGLSALCCSGMLYADGIKINGSFPQIVRSVTNTGVNSSPMMAARGIQTIKLLKIELSDEKQQKLQQNIRQFSEIPHAKMMIAANKTFPASIQLGMGNVPVLDQGMHGSCVTFASTAALNAAMNKGDSISQLCQLQLGNYLAEYGYGPSGWNGSFGPYVLSQMERFGFVPKTNEAKYGCGGYTSYPINDYDPQNGISIEEYHRMAQQIPDGIGWSPVLDVNDAFEDGPASDVLEQVKAILNKKDRLTFGVLLFDFDKGLAGALGSHKATYDTWVLTPETLNDLRNNPEFGGHEMVITGYDDNAVAKDNKGRTYRGLLTLRNSWGKGVGHQGDFYMSYDYFKTLVMEIQRIRVERD